VESYFLRLGDRAFRATAHTGGAWSTDEQHFSPLGGLLTHAIDRFVQARGEDGLVTARITFEILGTIAIEEFDVDVDVVRPGRTIELLEVVATARGRAVVRGRAWRLVRLDTASLAGGSAPPMPAPASVAPRPLTDVWPGGYIASIEYRPVDSAGPGRARAWIRTPLPLVVGEESSRLARFVGLLDTANGIAVRVPPADAFYPNVDLAVYLHRQPAGEWVGLDTTVVFGAHGQGLTSTVVHDEHGPVGRMEQMLTIRPRTERPPGAG
jgi:hypothetical protein